VGKIIKYFILFSDCQVGELLEKEQVMKISNANEISNSSTVFASQNMQTSSASVQKREQNVLSNDRATSVSEFQKDELVFAVSQMNESLKPLTTKVKFALDEQTGEVFVNVVDTSSGELIRRIPSEEAARIAKNMKELVGMIFDQKI